MRFKLHDHSCCSESESDWDTAVDLVKTTTTRENFLLEAEGGAIIRLFRETRIKQCRHLEPNFDEEDRTGKVGPCVFHDDTDTSSLSVQFGGGYAVAVSQAIKPISVTQFKEAFMDAAPEAQLHAALCNDEFKESIISLKVIDIDHSLFDFIQTGVDSKIAEQILTDLPEDIGQKGVLKEFHFDLPAEIETNLRRIGEDIRSKENLQTLRSNHENAKNAMVELDLMGDDMPAHNPREIRLADTCR
jgi:hypothetical protein